MTDLIGPAIAIAALVLAVVQFWASLRTQARQRDAEMTRWGAEVIELMAALETACAPLASSGRHPPEELEMLGERASAMVDRGRLFFPNVPHDGGAGQDVGTRVKLLDEVLRACYVANYLAVHPGADRGQALRAQVWQARRSFVTLLQKEMGSSLRELGVGSAGAHIPKDPTTWKPRQID